MLSRASSTKSHSALSELDNKVVKYFKVRCINVVTCIYRNYTLLKYTWKRAGAKRPYSLQLQSHSESNSDKDPTSPSAFDPFQTNISVLLPMDETPFRMHPISNQIPNGKMRQMEKPAFKSFANFLANDN